MITISKCMSFTTSQVGGEYNHFLTKSELPKAKQELYYEQLNNNGTHFSPTLAIKWTYVGNIQGNNSIKTSNGVGFMGEGKPVNIIQPYVTTFFWKRVS